MSVSPSFAASIKRTGNEYLLNLKFSGSRLAEGFGGARYSFKSRYRGVDFYFNHARVIRTRYPMKLVQLNKSSAGYRIGIFNNTSNPLWNFQSVPSFGFKIVGSFLPPAPGKWQYYTIKNTPGKEFGDYPVVISAKVNGETYSVTANIRHADRVRFTSWTGKEGDSSYWKNPEYDDKQWLSNTSACQLSSSLHNTHWLRGYITLDESSQNRKTYILLGDKFASCKVFLNMTEIRGNGKCRKIPAGVLMYNQKNVLSIRVPSGMAGGKSAFEPVLLVYGKE